MKSSRAPFALSCLSLLLLVAGAGCSSTREVKTQQYADLKNTRNFEYEMPVVWKGVEKAFANYKVVKRTPSKEEKAKERMLETDWIFSQSNDKYVEYRINDTPRKKYLQTRLRFKVVATQIMGGTDVAVNVDEEIEKLKDDGSTAGYESVERPDPARAADMLEKINLAILSAAP